MWGANLQTNGWKVYIWHIWEKEEGGAGKGNKEEEEGGKSGTPATFLSAPESIKSVTKYCINFEVNNYTMAAFSNTENVAYMVEQKVKK